MNKDSVQRLLYGSTLRLTLTFLAIIMTMSLTYSAIIFSMSKHRLEMQRPIIVTRDVLQDGDPTSLEDLPITHRAVFDKRMKMATDDLIGGLVMLNLGTLLIGAAVSYLLARAAMRPIKQNIQAQAEFVSDVSHELRTPLTALQATNEVALRKKKLSIGDARSTIAYTVEEITRLHAMTSGLLTLVKSEHDVVTEPVSIQRAASKAMTTVAPLAVAKQITIDDTTNDVYVDATTTGLEQVLTILLDNAIKYSPESTTVALSTQSRSGTVALSVRDQGIGMDAATRDRVFDRFYRADKARTHHATSGHGLGLAIAKRLVESFGGSIRVKSKPEQGTTFTVVLPATRRK